MEEASIAPFPIYIVLKTETWGSELYEQTTTVECAYTTLIRAHEHVLSEFKEFAEQQDVEAELEAVENYEKLTYEICRWRGMTSDEMYKMMVELTDSLRYDDDYYGGFATLWRVEKATLPPAARSRACQHLPFPAPFPIFVVTRECAEEPIVVSAEFLSLARAQEAAIAAYDEYVVANQQESMRLRGKGATKLDKYKRMVKRHHAVQKEAMERAKSSHDHPPRGRGKEEVIPEVMFLVHESILYPRGTYPLAHDRVTETYPEEVVCAFDRAFDFGMDDEAGWDEEEEDDDDDYNEEDGDQVD